MQLFAVKYFQKRFGLRKYQISTDLNFVGKESNELEKSDVVGVSLEDTIQYVNYQKKLRGIIENLTLEKALEIRISRRTFFYLKEKMKNTKPIKLKEKILKKLVIRSLN